MAIDWHGLWLKIKDIAHRYQLVRMAIASFLLLFLIFSIMGVGKAMTTDVKGMNNRVSAATEIFDKDNNSAGKLKLRKGTYVNANQISNSMKDAVISTEDRKFYSEFGFSISGLVRASFTTLWNKITGSDKLVGGSTITQQLVKNELLTQQQTLSRKWYELFLSIRVEKGYTKDQILAMYLSTAYFGHGVWGVQDAAQKYYGVNASDLDLNQSAMLAGMLQAPNAYDPIDHPEAATKRRNQVLLNMVDNKKLASSDANNAKTIALGATDHNVADESYNYPYYFDSVINEAIDQYGLTETEILNDGYKIYTSLDQKDQGNLQDDFADEDLDPIGNGSQAASIILDAKTGGVRAVVGGRSGYTFRGYNRATQMKRQTGSSIKPIVDYAPSLSRGYGYDSELPNHNMTFGANGYAPTNYDNYQTDTVPMYQAIEHSYNIPAVWLLDQMGVSVGYKAGIKSGLDLDKKDENLALAIGGLHYGVSPIEMAQAYTAFANEGTMSSSHFITKIVDASGKTVATYKKEQTKVWSTKVADEMTSMMLGVYTNGTGAPAKPYGYEVAGKTGTTEAVDREDLSNATDSWAVAYTPDVVTVTWAGYDSTDANHTVPVALARTVAPLVKTMLTQVIPNTSQTAFKVANVEDVVAGRSTMYKTNGATNKTNGDSLWDTITDKTGEFFGYVGDGAKKLWDDALNLFN
jgi:penicillin-binding protein 2A